MDDKQSDDIEATVDGQNATPSPGEAQVDVSPTSNRGVPPVIATREPAESTPLPTVSPRSAETGVGTTDTHPSIATINLHLQPHQTLQNVFAGVPLAAQTEPAPETASNDIKITMKADRECPICLIPLSEPADTSAPPQTPNISQTPNKPHTTSIAHHRSCKQVMHTRCLDLWADQTAEGVRATCPCCRGVLRAPWYSWRLPAVPAGMVHPRAVAGRARWGAFAAAADENVTVDQEYEDVGEVDLRFREEGGRDDEEGAEGEEEEGNEEGKEDEQGDV